MTEQYKVHKMYLKHCENVEYHVTFHDVSII